MCSRGFGVLGVATRVLSLELAPNLLDLKRYALVRFDPP